MTTFLMSILASFIGALILVLITSLVSMQARWILTGFLSRLLGADIDFVFRNKAEAEKDLKQELKNASKVSIFTGRGNELQRDTFSALFLERPEKYKVTVRILLPETKVKQGEHDWTKQREEELAQFDPAFGNSLLNKQIEANVSFLQNQIDNGYVELRRYNYPHIGRIILTEKSLYFRPYGKKSHGRSSKTYKYKRGGEMYSNFHRLFDQLWNSGIP